MSTKFIERRCELQSFGRCIIEAWFIGGVKAVDLFVGTAVTLFGLFLAAFFLAFLISYPGPMIGIVLVLTTVTTAVWWVMRPSNPPTNND